MMHSITELAAEVVRTAYDEMRPRYLLLVDATPDEERRIMELRRGRHIGTIQWHKLKDSVFYTYDTHHQQMQDEFICDVLKHRRFVLAEIFVGSFRYTGIRQIDDEYVE